MQRPRKFSGFHKFHCGGDGRIERSPFGGIWDAFYIPRKILKNTFPEITNRRKRTCMEIGMHNLMPDWNG